MPGLRYGAFRNAIASGRSCGVLFRRTIRPGKGGPIESAFPAGSEHPVAMGHGLADSGVGVLHRKGRSCSPRAERCPPAVRRVRQQRAKGCVGKKKVLIPRRSPLNPKAAGKKQPRRGAAALDGALPGAWEDSAAAAAASAARGGGGGGGA
eukprot:gene17984-biopygen6425